MIKKLQPWHVYKLAAAGAGRCSDPNLYYKFSSGSSSTSSSWNCTERAIYIAEDQAKKLSFGKDCISYMKQGFQEGRDGDLTFPESMEVYRCQKDEYWTTYYRDMCCPSKSLKHSPLSNYDDV